MRKLTEAAVRRAVKASVNDIIATFKSEPDTNREAVLEEINNASDSLWGELVKHGMISSYDVDDLIETSHACGAIINVAKEDAWVEDDSGLWEGMAFGVLASIAYFSLRNLMYEGLKRKGHDTNEDQPFQPTLPRLLYQKHSKEAR